MPRARAQRSSARGDRAGSGARAGAGRAARPVRARDSRPPNPLVAGRDTGPRARAGPPLLYVHGGLSGAFEVVPILAALAKNHRVVAVDRPGHGLADPFDYRGVDLLDHGRTFLGDIVDAIELPTVDLVANSMGALLSVAFAIDASSRCLAARARRRAVRDRAKAAPPDASRRAPAHRPAARPVRVIERDA